MSFLNFVNIPMHMDFEGQRRAENYARIIITIFGVIGLIWGYVEQKFSYTIYTLGVGFAISVLLSLPPWPMYRRHPLQWQKVKEEGSGEQKKKK
ncbi:signal peptidase complex subunit 1 [Planococcus citri]|uniref:signal peptidase complex subunit 1 n=1 Tax=Planococcus citri TaxID=170843 RepID=UPI0031F980B9